VRFEQWTRNEDLGRRERRVLLAASMVVATLFCVFGSQLVGTIAFGVLLVSTLGWATTEQRKRGKS
jgi:hypothetical protein